ncbi:MAG TPA: hypothetical protein PKY82_35510 [Pyrinomonadaceae bacterium]|nr:hypothetical protein [Pyrinomonadaceae bacterium]
MDIAIEIKEKLGENWLAEIYRDKIRTLRTRAYSLSIPEKENSAEIQHTLLGVELKVGNIRLACPDLSTARYLQVFARLGCQEIAIPYDITKISTLADELESAWQQIILHFGEITEGKIPPAIGRMRSSLVKDIRFELDQIGAGEKMPQFKQSTKQRVT